VDNEAALNDFGSSRYIIYEPIPHGQGVGNLMAGLLAAHLLGDEFGRIVCVSPEFASFHAAFEPQQSAATDDCPTILLHSVPTKENSIRLVNYETAPNECALQEILRAGPNVLFLVANTYPRWPKIPPNFFFRFYRPKPTLLEILPYNADEQPPEVVVHLRQPDGSADGRKGLDDVSLDALGHMLVPVSNNATRTVYLVTNRVGWYDRFEKRFGWKHPAWKVVVHSAALRKTNDLYDPNEQFMQLWADWYALLTAKKVYHTHSDFSISAVHWQNIDSKTLLDYDQMSGKLEMADESWRIDGETARLVDRTLIAEGTAMLRLCGKCDDPLGRIHRMIRDAK